MTRPIDKLLVPFDQVTSVTKGVLFKAGLTVNDTSDAGLGSGTLNGTVGTVWEFVRGGLSKISGTSSNHFGWSMTSSSNAAAYNTLPSSGTIQWQVNLSDYLAQGEAGGLAGGKDWINLTDGAGLNNPNFFGPCIRTGWQALGDTTGYRAWTDGYGGISVLGRASAMLSGSAWAILENPNIALHDHTPTDSDGYVTLAVSYDGLQGWYLVNGVPVASFRHKIFASIPATLYLRLLNNSTVFGVAHRNLLVLNAPRRITIRRGGRYRITMQLHSYGSTAIGVQHFDPKGVYWTASQPGYSAQENMVSQIWAQSVNDLSIKNVSFGGMGLSWHNDMINGVEQNYAAPLSVSGISASRTASSTAVVADPRHTLQIGDKITTSGSATTAYNQSNTVVTAVVPRVSFSYISGGSATDSIADLTYALSTNKDRTLSDRSHFLFIGGLMNDHILSAANLHTYVDNICTKAIAQGIVPIFLIEQNGDLANATLYDNSVVRGYMVAEIAVQKAKWGDIGVVDAWAVTGGSSVQAQYVENKSNLTLAVHSNWNAQKNVYGQLGAAEVDRLIASPPAYAWWK